MVGGSFTDDIFCAHAGSTCLPGGVPRLAVNQKWGVVNRARTRPYNVTVESDRYR